MARIKGLPWTTRGAKDVTECKTAQEVMEKAGLNYVVDKCPLVAKMPFNVDNTLHLNSIMDGNGFTHGNDLFVECPNAYGTFRTDTNTPLGVVKSKYEVVQNKDAFTFFDEAIGKNQAIWQTAGCFGNGERIFVSAKLPSHIRVYGDVINNYLVFTNTHDGTSGVSILFTPIRVICQNTLNAAISTAKQFVRFRHTATVHSKITDASEILGIVDTQREEIEDIYNNLYKTSMTDKDVMSYIAKTYLSDAEYDKVLTIDKEHGLDKLFSRNYFMVEESEISTRKLNMLTNTLEYYLNGPGQKEIAGTAWGAYNAITGYYSNVAKMEDTKRMDSLLFGNANNVMINSLNRALTY